jgi:hypothetical protein
MGWNSKTGVRLSGFTLDLNDSRSAAPQNVIQFQAFDGSADGLLIDHIAILNGNSPSLQLVVAAARGFTYSGVVIDHNRLEMKPGTTQNQCIALTTVQGFGQILSARVTHNTCRGSGIQLDGVGPTAADNDVSGDQFGMGIFTAFVERTPVAAADWSNGVVTVRLAAARNRFVRGEHVHVWGATPAAYNGTFTVDEVTADGVSYAVPRDPGRYASGGFLAPDPTSRNCVIRGNILHDTPQTLDVNHTAPGGVENNCVDSLVENNRAYDLGGAGFANYASGARYVGNYAREVGFRGRGSAGGDGDDAAFAVADNGSGMPWYRSSGLVFEGNTSEPGSGRPRFGYYEEPSHLFNTRRQSNAFAGAEQSTVIRSPSCLGASARC